MSNSPPSTPPSGNDPKPPRAILQRLTESLPADEQLREISALHRQIINSAEEGIVVYGPDLRYQLWNPFMERITGHKAADVLGRHPLEVFPFLQEVGLIERLQQTLRGESTTTIEFPNLSGACPGGWTADSNAPLRNAHGEIIGVIGTVRDTTERKRAEIALRHSENMLQAIIDTEPECVKLLDAEARLIMMNRAGLAMIEVDSLEQVKGQCVCPLIDPDHWEAFMDLTRRVFQGESATLAFHMIGAKGRSLWLETHAVPFRDDTGKIVALLGITRDITQRRQAEEALLQSRERFRTLYDETPIMMHSIDRGGAVVEVNKHWLTTMGYGQEEVLGRQVVEFYTEASRRYVQEEVMPQFFRDGFCHDIPLQFVKKSGEVFDVLLSATGERDAEGTVLSSRAVILDITERKRAEEAIRRSEQLLRSVIDTVDEGFILLDREFRILSANRTYCRPFGLEEAEVIGRHCYEVSHGTSRPCYESGNACTIKEVFDTGRPHSIIHTQTDKEGNVRHIESRGFPLIDEEGQVTSAIEVIQDLTDRHLLEKEQLKAEKMDAIGTLAGGIAHDFNNLLQGVFGYLSLAKMEIGQPQRAISALDQAETALTLAKQLTMQLLTFAKGGKPVKEPMLLPEVIKNSVKFGLSGSRCDWHLELEEGLWLVEADEGQIAQVIQNIVLNAAQAMPNGGHVEIAATNIRRTTSEPAAEQPPLPLDLPPGAYVAVVISDNGPGIAPADLAKIFEPYFTTKATGSGLGLATSYSIVKNHGGLLTVTSTVGQGTSFAIYLPALMPHPNVRRAAPPARKLPKKRARILVMDDDEVIRNVVGQMLMALGHTAEFAAHGEEAVLRYRQAMANGQPFDVVILDLTIRGGTGGYETLSQLLRIDQGVKAVVSSGYSNDTVLADFRAHGFKACLNKPYALKELGDMLQMLL